MLNTRRTLPILTTVTCSFSFGRGSACIVDCINVAGAPCQGAYTTYGPYGKGAYAALGLPAGGDCPGVEVLLVKVAQEYHLTDQQTVTTVALPVNSTEVLAVPDGGAVIATPPADFVSHFPQSYQQICSGDFPVRQGGSQHVPNAAACMRLSFYATQASASRALFQLNSTDGSAVFTPPAWGCAPEPIRCNNITIEIVSAGTNAWPLHAAAPQPLLLP